MAPVHRKSIGFRRRDLLAATGTVAASMIVADRALASPQGPAPVGDDIGFLAFAVVAESVLAAFFTAALALDGAWSASERKLLGQAHARQRDHVDRINTALGPNDAVPLDSFARTVRVGSRARALRTGRELETLLGGVYLNGVGYSEDAGTRILLGRLLAVANRHNAVLTRFAGLPLGGLPAPVDLDAAGQTLDTYIEDPT
jgi:hypothetical protein